MSFTTENEKQKRVPFYIHKLSVKITHLKVWCDLHPWKLMLVNVIKSDQITQGITLSKGPYLKK